MRDTGPSSTLFRLLPLLLLAVPVDTKAQDTPSLERTAVEWMTLLMEGEFQRAAAQMSPTNSITLNELETVQLLGYFDAGGERVGRADTVEERPDGPAHPHGGAEPQHGRYHARSHHQSHDLEVEFDLVRQEILASR
jgi:hypothetical protein